MDIPDPNAPIATRFRWLTEKATQLGFNDLYDCILKAITHDVEDASALQRGIDKPERIRHANGKVEDHGEAFRHFVSSGAELSIKHQNFRTHLNDSGAVMNIFNAMLKGHLLVELSDVASSLHKPSNSYLRRDISDFSFADIKRKYVTHAPTLWGIFYGLFVIGNTWRGKTKESSSVLRDHEVTSDEDDIEFLADVSLEALEEKVKQTSRERTTKDNELIGIMGFSVCCFAYSRDANMLQGAVSYYLHSTGTSIRVITVLNRVGVCSSYGSVNQQVTSIGSSCKADYTSMVQERPWILCIDNLDVYAHVRQILMNRVGFQEHKLAGYILFPDKRDGTAPAYLKRSDLNREAALDITPLDLLLTEDELSQIKDIMFVRYYRVLKKFLGKQMKHQRQYIGYDPESGVPKQMVEAQPQPVSIDPLPLRPSKLFTLLVSDTNETNIPDFMAALQEILEELGQKDEGLDFMVALVAGDYLTVRNIVKGMYQLRGEKFVKDRLDFLEPVISLFHLQMNVLTVEMKNFWEPIISRYATMFKNNKVTKDCKDFRAANYLFNEVVDGTMLAAFASHPDVDVSSIEDLKKFLDKSARLRLGEQKMKAGMFNAPTRSQKDDHIRVAGDFNWKNCVRDIIDDSFDTEGFQSLRYDSNDNPIPAKGRYADESVSSRRGNQPRPRPGGPDELPAETMNDVNNRPRARVDPDAEDAYDDNRIPRAFSGTGGEDGPEEGREYLKRDIVFENNLLLIRGGGIYQAYEEAITEGDVGKIVLILKYWMIMYQGTKLANYPLEMVHLVACLMRIWGKDIREMWVSHCIINMTGRKGAWLPLDLFCEYVVRELKKRKNPTSNMSSSRYWAEDLSRQIMTMFASKQTMHRETGASTRGQHTSTQDTTSHSIKVFKEIMREKGFIMTEEPFGRYLRKASDKTSVIPSAVDFFGIGTRNIASGVVLENYRTSVRAVWSFKSGEAFASLDDEELGDRVDPVAGGTGLGGRDLDDE